MNTSFLSGTVVSASFISLCAGSVLADKDYSTIVEQQVGPAVDAKLFPGAMIGIYKDGETSFFPIGTLNFDQDESPNEDTLYEIGSISKVFTGVLFTDSIRRGEIERDTLVNDLLPDGFEVQSKDGEELRLWHLTSHTSGWPTAPSNLAPTDGENPFFGYTQEMMFEAVNSMELQRAPGTEFEYSNFAVGLLGTLVSLNVDGEYESLVIERILEPLGIEDFTIDLNDEQRTRLAPATAAGRVTKSWGKTGPMDPAGMWITSAPSLLKFAIANIDDEQSEINESLSMARETLFEISEHGKMCYGWLRSADQSTYWHNGMTGGYTSYMATNPKHDVAIVLLTNGVAMETTMIGEKLIQAVMGMNPDPVSFDDIELLDESYSDQLVGTYHSAMGFDMIVSVNNGRLFAQITGQQTLELSKVGESRFKYKLVEAELEFTIDEDTKSASKVTLYQNGMEIDCNRTD